MTVALRPIPFVDLKAQVQALRDELLAELTEVLDDAHYLLGPKTRQLEQEFAEYCGTRICLTVSNGTDALQLALRACGVGPGDEVITVANTFVATVEAIQLVGAEAVLVDSDPRIGNLDPSRVEAALTSRTRAIVPVHLYGHPADMDPILTIAKDHGLRVIEDACQAHGAEYRGRRAGSLGDVGCFSFYCSKNLGACGEGGAVVTDDPALAEQLRLLRDHGSSEKYRHTSFGFNARGDEMQAAILRVKLPRLDGWNERRRDLAARYTRGLAGLDSLETPTTADWAAPVFHVYAVRTAQRAALQEWLNARGIATGIHYPIPVHRQPAYAQVRRGAGGLEVAERWAGETLSLPMYPELTDEDCDRVVEAIRGFFEGGARRSR